MLVISDNILKERYLREGLAEDPNIILEKVLQRVKTFMEGEPKSYIAFSPLSHPINRYEKELGYELSYDEASQLQISLIDHFKKNLLDSFNCINIINKHKVDLSFKRLGDSWKLVNKSTDNLYLIAYIENLYEKQTHYSVYFLTTWEEFYEIAEIINERGEGYGYIQSEEDIEL